MLSTAQVAAILGVNPSRVRQLIRDGKLKATKLSPRVVVVDEADLEAYRKTPPPLMGRPRNDRPA